MFQSQPKNPPTCQEDSLHLQELWFQVLLGGTQGPSEVGGGLPNKKGCERTQPPSAGAIRKVAHTSGATNYVPGTGISTLPISFQPHSSQWRQTLPSSPLYKGGNRLGNLTQPLSTGTGDFKPPWTGGPNHYWQLLETRKAFGGRVDKVA